MEVGGFGNRLSELRSGLWSVQAARASSIAAHWNEQRRKQAAEGALLFGYFLLSKQKKVTSCRATPDKV
jgi:hypothetical protein